MKSLLFTCLFTVSCAAVASVGAIYWHGHKLTEIDTLSALPQYVQQDLHLGAKGFDGIGDKGKPFNATDAVTFGLPMHRFWVAAHFGDAWLVAVEHGGRGYDVRVNLYSGDAMEASCVLLAGPKNLKEVLALVQKQCPMLDAANKAIKAVPGLWPSTGRA